MDKNRKNIFLALLGALLLIVLAVWSTQNHEGYSWKETFKKDSKDPYGLFAVHQLLENYTTASSFIELKDSLAGQFPEGIEDEGASNYVYFGEGLFMRPQDRDALLAFVSDGNKAFISAKVLPFDLMFYLYFKECTSEPWNGLMSLQDSNVNVNFHHNDLFKKDGYTFNFSLDHLSTPTSWHYFPDTYFCDIAEGLYPIGYSNNSDVNFVQIPYGNGSFYLHSQPKIFTNLFMVSDDGREYAEKALSHLNDGPIYWDEFSRIPEHLATNFNNNYRNSTATNHLSTESPLQYILEQPPLAWAWYLLLSLGLIFMVIRAKRRQRIIPVSLPPQNTSLQFLQTIGWLFFQKGEHQQLAVEAIKLFRTHVKERYGLAWGNKDPYFIQQLINRSGVDEELITKIIKDTNNIPRYTGLLGPELVKFHQRLERFYKEAK